MTLIARTILKQIEKQICKSNGFDFAEQIKFCLDYNSNKLFFEIDGVNSEGNSKIKSNPVPISGEGAEKWSQITVLMERLKEVVSADEIHFVDAILNSKQGGFSCDVYFVKSNEKRFKTTFLSI